jgi:hypothetical protein
MNRRRFERELPSRSRMSSMVRGRSGRRIAATLALTVWVGFAGGAEAAEILAQAFGFHGNCHMACCRERADAACPRGARTTGHHGGHGASSENGTPPSPFSISPISGCGAPCCLQLGGGRADGLLARVSSPARTSASERGRSIPSLLVPKSDIVSSFPARAPPA